MGLEGREMNQRNLLTSTPVRWESQAHLQSVSIPRDAPRQVVHPLSLPFAYIMASIPSVVPPPSLAAAFVEFSLKSSVWCRKVMGVANQELFVKAQYLIIEHHTP